MSILGVDFGDRRIGFAVASEVLMFASPIETYTRGSLKQDVDHILLLIKKHNVTKLVFGLPVNMDGTLGERAIITKEFVNRLKEFTDIEVDYQDERLTTISAERILIESGMRREKRKGVIDQVAAVIILQTYLDTQKK